MRVLISEDDRLSRRLLEAMLAAWGYDVCVTTDGVEALEALQKNDAPSLAVLDWSMPRLDGIEVCKMVREASRAPLPYIILLTAREGTENMVESMRLQACTAFVDPKQTIEGPRSPSKPDHSLRRRTPRAPLTVSVRSMSRIWQRTCDRP